MKRKRWNAGFSLIELLIAVAIVAILCGVGFVGVLQQRNNLAILEADETAKEIFLAAQEHLSMAALQGSLSASKYSEDDLLNFKITGVDLGVKVNGDSDNPDTYAIFNDTSVSGGASVNAFDIMLPQGAVDGYVLNHRYAVRYNEKAYKVLEVFYTQDNNYVFQHSGNDDLWTKIQTWFDGEQEVRDNPGDFHVDKSQRPVIMGWYGEDALLYRLGADNALEGLNLDKPLQGITPGLTVVNGPVLYALVTLNADYVYSDVNLKIEGVNGGSANISCSCTPATGAFTSASNRVFPLDINNQGGDTATYIVILDDVTTGLTFGTLPFDGRIELGSDIKLTVEAEGQQITPDDAGNPVVNPTILTGKSNTVTRNSLFSEGSAPTDAKIKNFRHLQNLSELNPASGTTVNATLEQNLCWTSPDSSQAPFKETVDLIHQSYSNAATPGTVSYTPVKTGYDMTFDDKSKTISDLEIDRNDIVNAGVFGTLNGVTTIENLTLDGTTVSTTSAIAAGALVGESLQSLTINNVSSSSGGSIQAADYAGGLIGHAADGLNVTNARTEISSGGSVKATSARAEAGMAGGLVGGASGNVAIRDAETLSNGSVTATNYAGGLIGQAKGGRVDVENARAHISSGGVVEATSGNGVAGGLIGDASGTVSVKDSAGYSKASAAGGNVTPGTVKATGGNGVAGGLIGTIQATGGSATVTGCAAANQVTASTASGSESIAGGLIGKTA